MQKCTYCGAELPESARFCGNCGNVQGAATTDAATTSSNTPPPPPRPMPSYNYPTPTYPTPAYPVQGVQPPWSTGGSGTGTPPPTDEDEDERKGLAAWTPLYGAGMGSREASTPGVPVVQGTPQIGGVPQAPQQVPQHLHYPPQQHGAPEHHHQLPEHHEHREQHAQHAQHRHDRAARATKVAGGSAVKTIMLVVTTVVVVAAGGIGAAAYFLSRPQPLISISSNYQVGNALAGANGTILHISGQKFSSNSAITFLLDGHVAPGNAGARSDSNGNFSADVTITDAWSVGTHTLTARDASNHSTKNSVSVTIVQPGQANTPGPNGAPPDDASFALGSSLQGQVIGLNQSFSRMLALVITGHPDPAGGSVCEALDDGKVHFYTNNSTLDNATPYNKNAAYTCKGSYKGGKVTFDRTTLSEVDTFTYTRCTLNGPHPDLEMTGTYTSNGTFTGTFNRDAIPQSDFACTNGYSSRSYYNVQGTWTGTVSGLKD